MRTGLGPSHGKANDHCQSAALSATARAHGAAECPQPRLIFDSTCAHACSISAEGLQLCSCWRGRIALRYHRRFIRAEFGDRKKGTARWEVTGQWRKENTHGILTHPGHSKWSGALQTVHPHFLKIKEYYPHSFVGKAKNGSTIYVEQPGKVHRTAHARTHSRALTQTHRRTKHARATQTHHRVRST
jgi:hypothetical protein